MDIGEILLTIFGALLLIGFFVGIFYLNHLEEKLKKHDSDYIFPNRDIGDIDNYEPLENRIKVRIVDMFCKSELVGMKEPKSIQTFIVRFEDEYGRQFDLPVIEDYYHYIEVNQEGILTTVDNEFYSFELA